MSIGTILLIVLVLILLGVLPYGRTHAAGLRPKRGRRVIVVILLVLVLMVACSPPSTALGVHNRNGLGATHRFADRANGADSPLHRPGRTAHNFTVTTCRGQYETVHRRKLEETSYGQHR